MRAGARNGGGGGGGAAAAVSGAGFGAIVQPEAEPASVPRSAAARGGRTPAAAAGAQPPASSPLPATPLSAVRRISSGAGFDSTMVDKEDYYGTVVVHNEYDAAAVHSDGGAGGNGLAVALAAYRTPATPAGGPAGAAEYGSAMVVGGTMIERSGTVRRSNEMADASGDGADGCGGGGGGYLAAVRAAAAEAQNGDRHAKPLDSPLGSRPAAAHHLDEVERVRERLHSLYDGGLVVPLPFFKASQAQPLALLCPSEPFAGSCSHAVQGPLLPPPLPPPLAGSSRQEGAAAAVAAAGAPYRRVQHGGGGGGGGALTRSGGGVAAVPPPPASAAAAAAAGGTSWVGALQKTSQPSLPPLPPLQQQQQQLSSSPQQQSQPHVLQSNAAPPASLDLHGVDPEAYGVVLELVQQSAAMARQRGEVVSEPGSAAVDPLPPTVVTQLLFHPALQNLARTLTYNRRCLASLPLDRRAQEELQESCNQLSAALQCVLSL
ncbi:hypothetical protein VOLCADRAFT_95066 [Volvox carteri f. nagariensis]|uniref:Uncharacterized protein n=1 Tax=Volvox carteri f. nagariensis TaxID=3068 RepID=D8U6I0_VOLCA|nr:uncharacterized protein VOLCADRAFT_95066 [Volvox carteri f. nagariensis]EFJ44651.1 hypothetical protein VOLCADRAFT_95066 [Volvox carteri f. nagariensis]|eukprot:XP_002954227.1 hypothetical protein VOLCADRAFT_95066 [Volvox carteri f. nagariensis]